MAVQKNRDPSFDALRGLAIIAVVAIHTRYLGGIVASLETLYFCQPLIFAVPTFFFISGYWSSKRPIESFADYINFLRKRFSRVLVPYLFWSSTILGYSALKTHNIDGYKIIFDFLTGGACPGYYFIIVLVQFYITTSIFQYINRRAGKYGLILIFVLYIMILLVLYLSRLYDFIWHIPYTPAFYSWIVYYEIGMFAGIHNIDVLSTKKNRVLALSAILVFCLVSFVETGIIYSKFAYSRFAAYPIKYSSFLYSVSVIFGFLSSREYFKKAPRILSTIGHYSFGIYFIHVIVLGQIIPHLVKFSLLYSYQPVYLLVLILTTLLICYVIIYTARKLLPDYLCSKILGF